MSRPHTPEPSSGQSSAPARHGRTKPGKGKHKAMKSAAKNVLEVLPTVLDVAQDVASNFGVPGLEIGFAALSKVVEKVQTTSANIDGVEELNESIALLKRILERFRGKSVPAPIQQRISDLFSEWKALGDDATELKSRNRVMRFLRSDADAKQLSGLVEKYNRSLRNAQLESTLSTELAVNEMRVEVHEIKIQLDESFMPTHAKKAQYDAIEVRKGCLKGTRVVILREIHGWVERNVLQLIESSDGGGKVYFVNGQAGMGKTAIAFSVADECYREGRLAGSFFCRSTDAECSNPGLIFVTLSRQLCRIYPAYKEKVVEALKKDPDLVNAGVSRQLEKLIVEPLEALKGKLDASVIVIDALDECKDPNATSTILSALDQFVDRLAPLLFLITSRPEPPITARFVKSNLANATTPLILHEIKPELAIEDIRVFLRDGFEEMKKRLGIEGVWPFDRDIVQLAGLSGGLFIFAKTALTFIEDSAIRDPERQLQALLGRQSEAQPAEPLCEDTEADSKRAETIMDSLYLQILETSYPNIAGSLLKDLRTILGAIALAQEPLSTTGFARLLGISENSMRITLSGMRSVLYLPEDRSQPVQVIHATFPQYLLRESFSKPAAFHIRSIEGHIALLSRCFDVLNTGLHRDIFEIKNPTLRKHEISNLPEKVARHIPPHLGYACKYWAAHLQASLGDGSLDGLFMQVQLFLHNTLLYWIEACIWLDAFATAVTSLDIARGCFTPSERLLTFVPLLIDCRRFAPAYSYCIQDAPLQVYYSALSLAPNCSLIAKAYAKEVQHPLIIRQGARMDWGPHLATIQQDVYSVAFAPNGGARFVTGGFDKTIYVWDSTTYTKILSIGGRTDSIFSVRYSPDGKYIVSSSADETVRLWDAESGAHIRTLKGHRDWVYSVAYSAPDHVLSATRRGEVKLWDASEGRCTYTFNTGVDHTWQVSMSPNGSFIAYGTNSSLCLWNISTEERAHLDLPGDGQAALFSPDGQYVAGATEAVVHIWRVSDRALTRVIDVPQKVTRMAFSGDGAQIGCGCRDGAVRLWQVASDDPPLVLTGHQDTILDVTWSPDGSQLIATSDDNTVRVWDPSHHSAAGDVAQPRSHRHSPDAVPRFAVITDGDAVTLCGLPHTAVVGKSCGDVIPVPEGAPLVTLCSTIGEAWSLAMASKYDGDDDLGRRRRLAHTIELFTGRHMFQRRGSSMRLVLSQDGSLLAYTPPNADRSVHICDLRSGTDILTFAHGHTSYITAASFSADGKRLATGSADHNVKIWDVASGRLVASHSRHTEQVESVALSSDGRLVVSGQHEYGGARVLDTHTGRVSEWREYLNYAVDFIFTSDDRAIMALTEFALLVWDVASETCIHDCSFYGTTELHSVNFSSDDTGVIFGEGGGTIELWWPGERTWPVYTINDDGWVYAKRPGRTQRLCWLPVEWRNPLSSDENTFCVFDYGEWKVIELDMSQLLLGAETWSQ